MIQWAAEGLRPHSAIGAASGVTAPLEGRPAKDFSNWSCDTLDSSSACDRGPRKNPGAFFVPWQQCRAPRREPPIPFPPSVAARRSGLEPDRSVVKQIQLKTDLSLQQTALAAAAVKQPAITRTHAIRERDTMKRNKTRYEMACLRESRMV
uniref:Uncharacterized protein n=1 Tax=uncultured prokaryote TaxID=198431 RepID=A0A0H5PWV2_9ZZZZ|nr:hypothetical protein [uncultured prokaryote]